MNNSPLERYIIIKPKSEDFIELAKQLGNVSAACKTMGYL